MIFLVQFLDSSAAIIADWHSDVHTARAAIDLVSVLEWPEGTVRMRIVDADGRVVQERLRADDR